MRKSEVVKCRKSEKMENRESYRGKNGDIVRL